MSLWVLVLVSAACKYDPPSVGRELPELPLAAPTHTETPGESTQDVEPRRRERGAADAVPTLVSPTAVPTVGAKAAATLASNARFSRTSTEPDNEDAGLSGQAARFFVSRQRCLLELARRANAGEPVERVRIAAFNVRWFPFGGLNPEHAVPTDIDWLACVIASLDAPVVAVQEFTETNPTAGQLKKLLSKLDELTAGEWSARFDGCPGRKRLHVGFLFNTADVQARGFRQLDRLNPKGGCKGQLRPGFAGYFVWPGGIDMHLVSVHLKANGEKRSSDMRRDSVANIQGAYTELQQWVADPDVVFAGDFNVVGYQKVEAAAAELSRLQTRLGKVNPPLRFLGADTQCSYLQAQPGSLLDFFVAPVSLAALPAAAQTRVFGPCRAQCRLTPEAKAAHRHLSDHCPIVLELNRADLD